MIAFMRRHPLRSLLAAVAALLVCCALMPLSFALNAALPSNGPVTAKAVSGSIWRGVIADLKIGPLALGRAETTLGILPLFLARGDFRIDRASDEAQPGFTGILSSGFGGSALRGASGPVALTMIDKRLPLSRAEFQDFSVRFQSGQCREASGRVRLVVKPGELGSFLGTGSGFLGQARCDGGVLLLPLVSGSAMERADIRIDASGDYVIAVQIQNENPQVALLLAGYGFAPVSGGYRLIVKGKF